MNDELTREDIRKMKEELDYRRLELMPGLIEEVKRTRAFGDLSENFEYKMAKQQKNVKKINTVSQNTADEDSVSGVTR